MTRRAVVPVQIRMLRIARFLYEGGIINTRWIVLEFGVNKDTAERDMRIIECHLPIEHMREFVRGHPRKFHIAGTTRFISPCDPRSHLTGH